MNKTNSKKEINNVDVIFSLVEDELEIWFGKDADKRKEKLLK